MTASVPGLEAAATATNSAWSARVASFAASRSTAPSTRSVSG
ncbi:hypothetical protein I7X12_13505 [Halosimplex litoreum]|uniref:Uncharacterized protein n=1 Tax=Halosimplex litoreum TaxID=1198301 RepID=A0A7U3WBX1_9EURY|nr:hypothetical protein I7X12_13505 [Halosimplex litoreum]